MTGIILVGVLNIALFAWFFYLAAKDPSNMFKRRRPPGDDSTTPPEARRMVVIVLILLSLGVALFIMFSDTRKNDNFSRLEQAAHEDEQPASSSEP